MQPDIHILAACTDRKRLIVPNRLRLRTVPDGDSTSRAKSWWERLEEEHGQTIRAEELYAGDHWAAVRRLPLTARQQGLSTKTWVISAGYGLVPVNACIRPYSATFSGSHPDSVTNRLTKVLPRKTILQTWWRDLCAMRSVRFAKPRSLAKLARTTPKAKFIIIASPDYLLAMEEDILATFKSLTDSNQLIIISSNSEALTQPLRDHLVPSVATLQPLVGGALGSLHARVALMILENAHKWDLRADVLRYKLKKLAASSPPLRKYDRNRLSDLEVSKLVRQALKRSPRPSCTTLLQELRDSGLACEQKRFTELYWAVKESIHAS
jgi:hypothetical protein